MILLSNKHVEATHFIARRSFSSKKLFGLIKNDFKLISTKFFDTYVLGV